MNRIVHIMLDCFYKNGYGYQENILPAKHKQLGYDVSIVCYYQDGDETEKAKGCAPVTYMNPDDIPVHVLEKSHSVFHKIPILAGWTHTTIGLKKKLSELNPNIIFLHGICKFDNIDIIDYCKKNPKVKLYVDNHSDYYNSPINGLRNKILRYGIGRYMGKILSNYAEQIWGVTPWRVIYQQKVYGVSSQKSGLLVMGGDETKIKWNNREIVRQSIRKQLSIPNDAFVIITGGKIDLSKNIHCLVEAFNSLKYENVFLIIFGRYEKEMIKFRESIDNSHVIHVGWITPEMTNDYYLASDLACFPGTHSVLWEQACACGLPAVFKDWNGGFNHVDIGGNCILLKDINTENIRNCLIDLIDNKTKFEQMKQVASTIGRKTFSYIDIAKRSIGLK